MAAWLPWTFVALSVAAALSSLIRTDAAGLTEKDRAASVQRAFTSVTMEMADEGRALLGDSTLFRQLLTGGTGELASAFETLADRHEDPSTGVELLDPRGNILAWSGRTWNPGPEAPAPTVSGSSTARVDRVGALVVLRVLVSDPRTGLQVRLHRPLSVETPSLERLFGTPTFAGRIADLSGRRIVVLPRSGLAAEPGHVPLLAFGRDTVASAAVVASGQADRGVDDVTAALTTLALLTALAWVWRRAAIVHPRWWAVAPAVVAWVVRLALTWLEIPARWAWGSAVDPRLYAAPSPGGFAATPLDLALSGLTLFVSVWWLDRGFRSRFGDSFGPQERWFWLAASAGWLVAAALLTRGYVVVVRSLVVDSTLSLYDASSLVPSLAASLLMVSLFFVTLTFRTIWTWSVRTWTAALQAAGIRPWPIALAATSVLTGLMIIVIGQIGSYSIVPWWVVAIAWSGAVLIIVAEERLELPRAVRWVPHALAVLLLALPVLDHEVGERQWQAAERMLREQIQPGDSWFSFMVGSDLRSLSMDRDAASMLFESDHAASGRSAFRVWSRTLLSQQRLNSGVALFDEDGIERDRFMSGIGTFDQQGVLRAVFDADEESVQTIDLSAGGVRRVFYGGWTTVRGDDNVVHGTVALILSPSTEESIILSTASNAGSFEAAPPVAEFREGRALWSDVYWIPEGAELARDVGDHLRDHPGGSIRVTDGSAAAGLAYLSDPHVPGRVLAAAVPGVDVRWWLFHAVKIAFVFAALGLAGALLRPSWRAAARSWLPSFQGRLFMAFAAIAVVPLVILAWSNQTISTERNQRNQEETLRRDLALVQQRLSVSLLGEEDLERGLDDDFCRSVAADLGIEFSIFRSERLRASSRPELFTSGVLDARLPAEVFARLQLRSAGFHLVGERIGGTTYAVGYGTFDVGGRPAGVVAIPTLDRQAGIDEDLAERNAFLLVTAAGVFLLVLAAGGWLSERIAGPVRTLTKATEQLRDGRTPPSLRTARRDEIGSLMNAFDRMSSELDESRRRIAQAEREQAWREMAKQVAHEIKNPLTPIKLSLQHLRQAFKDRAKDRDALVVRVADTVLEQVEALARIATEFSRFARLPERRFMRIDLLDAVREASRLFSNVPGVRFTLDLSPEPAVVVADADELRRVFINLFRNSVQAMDGRGEVHVRSVNAGRTIRLTIRDTGPGVATEARSWIFEPSFSTKTEGMGLGLAIVRSVIEDLGGSIDLLSDGPGATFRIIIPLY
jgi:signal transduction histidine kinase